MSGNCLIPVRDFMMRSDVPDYHYKQNIVEGLAGCALFPAQWAVGLFENPMSDRHIWMRCAVKVAAVVAQICFLPLTTLGICLRYLGKVVPHPYYDKLTESGVPRTSEIKTSQIYEILEKFNKVCSNNELKYWMDAGTLLGAERHKGMIPWDDDADVCIYGPQEILLKELKDQFEAEGLHFSEAHDGVYQIWIEGVERENRGHLDIFVFDWTKTNKNEWILSLKSPEYRALFPGEYYTYADLGENDGVSRDEVGNKIMDGSIFQTYRFGPINPITGAEIKLSGIKNQEAWSKRYYGNDCMKYGVNSHYHFSVGVCHIALPVLNKYKYEIENFEPAPWVRWRERENLKNN